MSTDGTVLNTLATPQRRYGAWLMRAQQAWWSVTLLGQWAFLAYLAGFYGRSYLAGHPDWLNRNHLLSKPFVPGDPAWNFQFGAHVVVAMAIAFGGLLQMLPSLRSRWPSFHRWNGRAFVVAAVVGAATGLWITLVRHVGVSGNGLWGLVSINLNAVLILLFAALAWRHAWLGQIAQHRRWALRLFMAANGVWFMRIGLFGWYLLTGGLGLTDDLDGPMNTVIDFASYLLPLALLETVDRARTGPSEPFKLAATVVLLVATAYMVVGTVALGGFQVHVMRKI